MVVGHTLHGVGEPDWFFSLYMKNHTAISSMPKATVARISSCRLSRYLRCTQALME